MLSLPNLLTLSRILAVPILVFLLWRPAPIDYLITFVLYCIVGLTDYFDGYLARAQGQISRLGQFLDPIADKIMVAAVIIMLMASRKADGDAPIIQDLNVSVPVSRLAKWKTTFQLVALGALILGGAAPDQPWVHQVGVFSLWAAAALTLVTGWDYLRVGVRHMD
jgi:cardiolipin synthase (CMP-forming)